MSNNLNQLKKVLPIAALLFAVWGILSVLEFKNNTYSGYRPDGKKTVVAVEANSPSEKAGMQVGDVLVSINGIDIDDWKTFRDNPRAQVGETWVYEVSRNGAIEKLNLTFAPETSKNNLLNYLGALLGFIFLLVGFWVSRNYASSHATYFGLFAIFFSMVFFSGPYFSNGLLRDIVSSVERLCILTGVVGLIYFLLNYPSRSSFLDNSSSKLLILGPAVLMAIVLTSVQLLRPEGSGGLRTILQLLSGLVPIFYFGWALLLLIRLYGRHSAAERNAKGINLMLWGAVIGFLPILIVLLVNLISPKTQLLGADYAFLLFAMIPILFALGIKRYAEEHPVQENPSVA